MSTQGKKRIIIGITGASGAIYGQALLKRIDQLKSQVEEVAVIFSENGLKVWKHELSYEPVVPNWMKVFDATDIDADPASGSAGYTDMLICPCSMATLARIANGISTDLLTRAADVMLKERRNLVLVPREMPLSLIHIRNMETVTLAGGIICPASPSFYSRDFTFEGLVNTVVEKALLLCGFEFDSFKWGQEKKTVE